ncbi:hypothetical protein HDU78_009608, partial [Chytriomyces hyalinus]
QDALLCDYLKQHDDGNKKGMDVKAAVPSLQPFEAPILNTKIQSMRVKLSKSKTFDPCQDSQPMDLSSFKSKQLVADNDNNSDDETVLPPPHVAFPGMCCDMSQACPVSNKRHKPESPKKATVADANVYTKAVVQATPFVSTLHLHDLMRFKDEDMGLHHVQIILRIVTDHHILQRYRRWKATGVHPQAQDCCYKRLCQP